MSLPQRLEQIEGRLATQERRWLLVALLLALDTMVSAGGLIPNLPNLVHTLGL